MLDRRCHNYFAHSPFEIRLKRLRGQKLAGTFEDNLNPDLVPWHFARKTEVAVPYEVASYVETVRLRSYRHPPTTMYAVRIRAGERRSRDRLSAR